MAQKSAARPKKKPAKTPGKTPKADATGGGKFNATLFLRVQPEMKEKLEERAAELQAAHPHLDLNLTAYVRMILAWGLSHPLPPGDLLLG
jgi:hypothetical protein